MNQIFKRVLSGMTSMALLLSAIPIVSAHAEESTEPYPYTMFAASSDEGAITVNTGNFCVNGNVATNGTIVSSGNMNINGTRTEHADESMLYVLKKLNYSYFSGQNVETYTEDYVLEDLNININNPIDVDGTIELTGNINLNSGIKAVDDVILNGEVKNSNNAVICSETGDINIETSNVNFNGLIYAPYGDIVIDSDNLNLNNVVIIGQTITIDCPNVNANYSSSMAELIGNESDIDVELYAMGSYNADVNAIDIEWITNYTNSNYEVLYSEDNENYTSVATVTDATTYQYLITEVFQKRYFKISLVTNYGEVIESIPFVATKSVDGYEVDLLDSDEDGLPDIYEIMIGTDVNLPDTDGDNLTDYQEIYTTGTDPTIYDSVVAGISDADADSDEDGLSNSVEITMGTNPQKADTDDDGLNDSEEGTYNTDPLNPDSDGDTLPDGDEPHIGLDPTNPETFGVPDAEYIVKQVITSDSDSLKKINTDSSPYMLSVEIEAAGYVEGNLKANETSYSKVISNSAMLGIAPELRYSKADTIHNVTLKFTIKPDYIENTLNAYSDEEVISGIKRLNVFKYFEDLNMLLPIETQFDVDNNLVYADVDELGTYCVMDIELWLNSFDIPEEEITPKQKLMAKPKMAVNNSFTEEQSRMGFNGETTDIDLPDTDENSTDVSPQKKSVLKKAKAVPTVNVTPIDVAILFQTSGQRENTFIAQKKMIVDDMNSLIKEYGSGNVRFCIITYDLTGAKTLNFTNNDIWFTNSNAVDLALNAINYQYAKGYTDRGNAFKLLQENVTFRDNASKYIIQVMNGSTDVGSMYFDQINTCKKLNINYSEIMPAGYYYEYPSYGKQVSDAINSTNGLNITFDSESTDKVFNHIRNHAAPPQVAYGVIIPTGWTKISLKGILDPDNGVKSDSDDLTDWEEVMTEMISWDNDGSVILPTVQDCIDSSDKGYALSGLERFKSAEYRSGMPSSDFEKRLHYVCNNTTILPIHSNPCDEDTDGDGIEDDADAAPFKVTLELFKLVDSIDYKPNVEFVDKRYDLSKKCYKIRPFNDTTVKNFILNKSLYPISFIAGDTHLVGSLISFWNDGFDNMQIAEMKNASKLMNHYLEGSGKEYIFSSFDVMGAIMTHQANIDHYLYNMKELTSEIEGSLTPGYNLTLSTTEDCGLRATCYFSGKDDTTDKGNYDKFLDLLMPDNCTIEDYLTDSCGMSHSLTHYENSSAVDWGNTIGESFVGIVCEAKCYNDLLDEYTGNTNAKPLYTMTFRYYIIDIYEWAYHFDGELKILHDLHETGNAQQFLMSGYLERTITWQKGEMETTDGENKLLSTLVNMDLPYLGD